MTRAQCSWWCSCRAAPRSREPPMSSARQKPSSSRKRRVAGLPPAVGLNFIANDSQPNAASLVVTFKPFEERKEASLGLHQVIDRLNMKFRQISSGSVVPLTPPPILGLGTGGGFAYVLEDLQGGDPK